MSLTDRAAPVDDKSSLTHVVVPPRPRLRVWGGALTKTIFILVIFVLFVLPMVMLAVGAFRSAPTGANGFWTLDGIRDAIHDPGTAGTIRDSVILAGSISITSTIIAVFFAWVVTRTTTPLRRLVTPMMAMILAIPQLFYALSWALLGASQVGLLNKILQTVTGTSISPINAESWPGIIGVLTLKEPAFIYLLLLGPFRGMDRSLEDASRACGSGPLRTFLRVTLPVLTPAILGVGILVITDGLEQFNIPLLLGLPAGIHVFSTQIYGAVNKMLPPNYAESAALSLLVTITIIALIMLRWRVMRGHNYATVTGKGHHREPINMGRGRYVASAVIVIYGLLALVLPLFQLVLGALQPTFGTYGRYSLDNFRRALEMPVVLHALRNTAIMGIVGGFVAMVLAVLIAYAVRSSSSRFRRLLELSTWLPWTMPGVVLGLGMLWAYLSVPGLKNLYASFWIVIIGLIVAGTPLASRVAEAALVQVGDELEESSRVAGASVARGFLRIIMPIISPSFIAGWIGTGIVISGNLAVPIMLSSPTNITVPVEAFQLYGAGEATLVSAIFVIQLVGIAVVVILAALAGFAVKRWRDPDRRAARRGLKADSVGAGVR